MRTRIIGALIATLTACIALTTPATAAPPQFFVWRWVDCPALVVNAQVHNLEATGYRYQVKTTFYNAAGATIRTNLSHPWIAGNTSKTTAHAVDPADETVRTRINRGHWEYPGGWQTWVNDQFLMDTTTEAC
jgi:hypothetical protein